MALSTSSCTRSSVYAVSAFDDELQQVVGPEPAEGHADELRPDRGDVADPDQGALPRPSIRPLGNARQT